MPDEIETANVRKMSEILECLSAFAYLAVLTNFTSALFIGLIVCKGIYLGFILVDIVIYIVENCVRIFLFLLSKLSSFGGRILGRSSGARSNNRKGNRGGSASIDRDECLFNRGSQELTTTSNCAGSCQKVDDISTDDEMNSEDQILKTLSQYERQAYGYIDKALALDETYESEYFVFFIYSRKLCFSNLEILINYIIVCLLKLTTLVIIYIINNDF